MTAPTTLEERRANALTSMWPWLIPEASWRRLHYVPGVTGQDWDIWWDEPPWPKQHSAICGLRFGADLPGVLTRLGMPRCAHCCRTLQIPPGNGAPANDKTLDNLRASYQ